MPRRFECPECGGDVTTYHRPGERARCTGCGAAVEVPDGAQATRARPGWVKDRQARPVDPEQPPVTPPHSPSEARGARRRGRQPERFKVGTVFAKGVASWVRAAPVFVTLTLLVHLPLFAWQYWIQKGLIFGDGSSTPGWDHWPATLGTTALSYVLSQLATATVIYAVFQTLRGRKASMGDCLGHVVGRLPMLVLVSLFAGLVTLTAVAASILPGLLLYFLSEWLGLFVMLICGSVAMLWMASGLWVTVAVCVVERLNLSEPLRRSWALTKGFRGRIVLLLLLLGLLGALLGGVLAVVTSQLPTGPELLLNTAINVVIASVGAVIAAVGYHDLRMAAEGLDAEELAVVFD